MTDNRPPEGSAAARQAYEPEPRRTVLKRIKRWRILQPLRPIARGVRAFGMWTSIMKRRARHVWWQRLRGRPAIPPPPEYKAAVILDYARRHGATALIETGTYLGDTVEATKGAFDRVWSVEIDSGLYEAAVRRFAADIHVTIIHGDSARILPGILAQEVGPRVFWLDGHFSGGITARGDRNTPIAGEL